jgi:hypothetical protein
MKAEATLRFGALALLIMGAMSCSSSSQPHFSERVFSDAWSMDAKDLERLRTSTNAVNLGDDIGHVVEGVGIPDRDHTIKKNEQIRFLTYYVTRQRADSALESDKVVIIALNSHNKVKAIYSNVDRIPSRNWP